MNGKKGNSARMLALCLSLALMVGSVPGLAGAGWKSRAAGAEPVEKTSSGSVIVPTATPSMTTPPTATPPIAPTATPPVTVTGGSVVVDVSLYKPTAPQSVSARSGSKRVRVKWGKVSGADGYYIYSRSADAVAFTKTATVKDGSKGEYDVKSLLQNETYYFQVAAYRLIGGTEVEGTLSAMASAKTAAVSATSKSAKKYATKTSFTKSPAYKKYAAMRSRMNFSKGFAIPGMKNTNVAGFACKTMMPQAICYAGNYLLVSAYDTKGIDYSVVYIVSKAAKSYLATIVLPSKAQVGGMAYDGTNIWISKGTSVACFPYSYVTETVNSGSAYRSLPAYTSICKVKTSASYMGYYDGTLWVGASTAGNTTMYGYAVGGTAAAPMLSQRYSMAMPSRCQGITFNPDGTLIVTRSYRTRSSQSGYISQIRTYMPSYGTPSYTTPDMTGKILKNTALTVTTLPPKAEGVAVYGTYTYTVFSSVQCSTCIDPVDRVIALKTSKLLTWMG